MADITYMTVTGLWTHIVDDGIVDGDPNPDVVHPMGKVVFAPKPSNTGFVTAGAAGESESVTLAEVPALVADGVLTDLQGNDGIRLAATIGGNPVRWVAQPTLLYGKKTLPSKSVTFDPPTVGTTLHLNDLFDDIGPQSPLVTTEVKAYRDQAVAARDEAQQIVDDVAAGVVPDSGVAARVTQPGQTKTALDAAYGRVKTVNGQTPNSAGNVTVAVDELDPEVLTEAVTDELSGRGLLEALASGTADDAAVVFTDADGNRGWLEWNATGGLTNLAKLLICAAIGFWRGPTEPAFPCVWFKTDPTTGELLDILDVTA
ncbi:minor tail protein [Gordonia phage Walrus]|uniref:Minor tail protein n=1 Tax=Gordonia phage Walrus TaxID=2517927 RepID=A0A481S2B7_9CAUD|nr:minor tail protein [Gordonia phage Walrus]QBG78423.1 minor tail protein [Gordonia phage Walrus]